MEFCIPTIIPPMTSSFLAWLDLIYKRTTKDKGIMPKDTYSLTPTFLILLLTWLHFKELSLCLLILSEWLLFVRLFTLETSRLTYNLLKCYHLHLKSQCACVIPAIDFSLGHHRDVLNPFLLTNTSEVTIGWEYLLKIYDFPLGKNVKI